MFLPRYQYIHITVNILSVVTHASETWNNLKDDERRIEMWEMKILRRIFGPNTENKEQ